MGDSGARFSLSAKRDGTWTLQVPADFDYESAAEVEAAAALTAAADQLASGNGSRLTHDSQGSIIGT